MQGGNGLGLANNGTVYPATSLNDDEFRTALRLRLNLPLAESLPTRCPLCRSRPILADAPSHLLSCTRAMHAGGASIAGHQFVSQAMSLLRHAGLSVTPEAQHLEPNRRSRPDLLITSSLGERVLTDHTIVNPLCASRSRLSVADVLRSVAGTKRRKYRAMAEEVQATFLPIPISVHGATSKPAMELLTLSSVHPLSLIHI